jgi:hypothetical protein
MTSTTPVPALPVVSAIRSPLAQILDTSDLTELTGVIIHEDDQHVVLRGRVSSFYLKAMAQHLLRDAVGNRKLINLVEVDAWA